MRYSVEVTEECGEPTVLGPIIVNVPRGSAAIDVMTEAVDMDAKYKFTATRFKDLGYFIDAINGIPELKEGSKEKKCYWSFLVKVGAGPPQPVDVGVSSYKITRPMSMIFRYTCSSKCPEER